MRPQTEGLKEGVATVIYPIFPDTATFPSFGHIVASSGKVFVNLGFGFWFPPARTPERAYFWSIGTKRRFLTPWAYYCTGGSKVTPEAKNFNWYQSIGRPLIAVKYFGQIDNFFLPPLAHVLRVCAVG